MIQKDMLDQYLREMQQLACRHMLHDSERHELLLFVERQQKQEVYSDHSYSEFFQGEFEFYSSNYKHALQHYLQAQSVPSFKLFCYRASAYVAKDAGDMSKAISFAQKALTIDSNDFASLAILQELFTQENQLDAAQQVQHRIEKLQKCYIKELISCNIESKQIEVAQPNVDLPILTIPESFMYAQPDFSNSADNSETVSTQNLIQRLYATNRFSNPYLPSKVELQDLMHNPVSNAWKPLKRSSCHYPNASQKLSEEIRLFTETQGQRVANYLELYRTRQPIHDYGLYVLQGWNHISTEVNSPMLLTEQSRDSSGGFYLRWDGKGIVINPGKDFVKNFHRQGLHIRDIDYVIVTGDQAETYADVKEIYTLNYQLNKELQELQIIHYYLSLKSHQALAGVLKPNFKQERNSVHCLELFLDSPDVERVEICEGIALDYFSLPTSANRLGITLELKSFSDVHTVRLCYASKTTWSPLLAHHFGNCDVLIAGFGHTSSEDYGRRVYNENCLGYYGTYSLLEAVQPRLLLCSEFDGKEGDIRIETIRLLRQQYTEEYSHSERNAPVIIPADPQLFLDLKTLQVQCTLSRELVDGNQIHIVKPAEMYGNIQYVSPSYFT